jgi:hypothetical protein
MNSPGVDRQLCVRVSRPHAPAATPIVDASLTPIIGETAEAAPFEICRLCHTGMARALVPKWCLPALTSIMIGSIAEPATSKPFASAATCYTAALNIGAGDR